MKTTRLFPVLALAISLGVLVPGRAAAPQQTAGELFEKALYVEEGQGDLQKAIALYQDIVKKFPAEREVAAKALLHIGICFEKLGKAEARNAYGRLLKEYADQQAVAREARDRLTKLEIAAGTGLPERRAGLTFKKIEFEDAGGSHQARLSPDGTKMLYIGVQDKLPRFSIRMKDFNSGQVTLLVDDVNADVENLIFEWSPDGEKAVYTPKRGELRTVAIVGAITEALWASPDKDTAVYPLDWSGANHAILIALVNRADKITRLAMLSETGGQPRTIVSGDTSELADIAQFSVDGTSVVGMRRREKNTDVYVWAVDGSEEIRITEHPAEDYYPLWSSDGRYIVYVSDRAKTVDLWAAPMSGRRPAGDPFRIQAAIGKNKIPTDLTRSGQLLFYAVSSAGQPSDLFVVSVNPKSGKALGTFRPFAKYPTQATFIRWSPDGSRIAYTSRKGNIQLPNAYVSSGGVNEELELPAAGHWIGNVEWARDGKYLVFPGWEPDGGRVGIFRISLDDKKIEPVLPLGERYGTNFKGAYVNLRWLPLAGNYMLGKLLTDEEEIYSMDPVDFRLERLGEKIGISGYGIPSPDGRFLIGISIKDKSIQLISIPDGTSRFLCPLTAEGWPAFSWSPDGKQVVWNEADRLKILSVEDGSVRELAQAGVNRTFTSFHGGTPNTAWSPDGTKIAYALLETAVGTGTHGELWVVEPSGRTPQKIADAPSTHPQMTDVVWHPSGKSISVQASAPKDSRRMFEHWVMENFLPPAPAAPKEDPNEFRLRKVWDKADPYFLGAPSPDGKFLTYADDYLGLGIRNMATGENRILLQNKSWANVEYCYNSIFSPSGDQVAYICQVSDRLTQLRIVNSDGTSTRVLRDGQDRLDYLPFGWTSDGKYILTHCSGSPNRTSESAAPDDTVSAIAFISVLDGSIKTKKDLPFRVPWAAKMNLSPDGRYVVGTYLPAEDSSAKDVFLLSIEGGKEAALLKHPADDAVIGWSPDGRQVLFTSDRTGAVGIWAVRVSEGKAQGDPELVRANLGNLRPLGMTREGRLFYGISTGSSDVFIAPIDPATGAVLGPPVKAVRKYETFNASPDWSPDGQFLACHSTRGIPDNESPALLIRSMQTGEVRELTPKTPGGRLAPYYLRWSPDGRSIIGGGRDEEGHVGALLSVDARTGEAKVLAKADRQADGTGNIIALDWSADGRSINFVRIGKEFRRICNLDLETRVEKEIGRYSKASGPFWLASSPDGKQLAFYAEGKLKILSRGDAAPRDAAVAGDGMVLAWMPDGKTILYGKAQDGSQDVVELWSVPASGGQPRKTGLSMSRLLAPRVSPDGKAIAFMASEQPSKAEIWIMENFLPGGKK